MKLKDGKLTLSATDLSSHFECERKVWLDLDVAAKKLDRPGQSEIERRMLERRGRAHEAKVLEYFKAQGKQVVSLGSDDESGPQTSDATLKAMRDGADVIYQGVFVLDGWTGKPDFLIRVEKKSNLGAFSYEPLDAKLARDEKARAVLQLCVNADWPRSRKGKQSTASTRHLFTRSDTRLSSSTLGARPISPSTTCSPMETQARDWRCSPLPHREICSSTWKATPSSTTGVSNTYLDSSSWASPNSTSPSGRPPATRTTCTFGLRIGPRRRLLSRR